MKLVGVLPESVSEAEAYLTKEGVHFDEVRQASLNNLGVEGPPPCCLWTATGS